jgi:hypothetical protein
MLVFSWPGPLFALIGQLSQVRLKVQHGTSLQVQAILSQLRERVVRPGLVAPSVSKEHSFAPERAFPTDLLANYHAVYLNTIATAKRGHNGTQ